ncbi:MarR family winged helix-turn-helix transcriptional regulator [Umezawaea sp.]|uniref:MarR family winged helix-turn-helix transcriptional regulator n=1 Tax=Umezawaea sp. TaxID=1955258 RepID=UPI002ED3C0FA
MDATPLREDLTLLLTALTAWTQDEVVRHLDSEGFGDLRVSHGYVFQHLQAGPVTVRELAEAMGVTAQAASKSTGELERMGYVTRTQGADLRVRMIELTKAGRDAILAGRLARAGVNAEMRLTLGEDAEVFDKALRTLAEATGALEELAKRRLRLIG